MKKLRFKWDFFYLPLLTLVLFFTSFIKADVTDFFFLKFAKKKSRTWEKRIKKLNIVGKNLKSDYT